MDKSGGEPRVMRKVDAIQDRVLALLTALGQGQVRACARLSACLHWCCRTASPACEAACQRAWWGLGLPCPLTLCCCLWPPQDGGASDAELAALKKRKLVVAESWKTYRCSKGPAFALQRRKAATELTADMLQK